MLPVILMIICLCTHFMIIILLHFIDHMLYHSIVDSLQLLKRNTRKVENKYGGSLLSGKV